MPNIPVADIPNAPRVAIGGPDTAGDMGAMRQTVAGVRENLQQRQVSPDAFAAPWQGLSLIGQGLHKIGTEGVSLAVHAEKAKAEYQIADASTALETGFTDFQTRYPKGSDPDKMMQDWEAEKKSLIGNVLSNPDLSPMAKERLQIEARRFDAVSTVKMRAITNASIFERAKESTLNRANSLLENGDLESAKSVMQEGVKQGWIFDVDAQEWSRRADQKHEVLQFSREIDADPKKASESISKLVGEDGTVKGSNLSVEMVEKLKDQAARAVTQRRSGIFQKAIDIAKAGDFFTREQVEKFGQDYLDKTDVDLIMQKIADKQPPDKAAYLDLWRRVGEYDPSPASDPHGEKRYELDREIMALPDGYHSAIRERLNKAGKPDADVLRIFESRIKDLTHIGFFGNANKDKDGKPEKPEEYERAFRASTAITLALNKFVSENPKATPEQVAKMFDDMTKQYKAQPKSSWFSWGKSTVAPTVSGIKSDDARKSIIETYRPTAPVSDDLVARVKQWEGFIPTAKADGKQMSVGYGTKATKAGETLTEAEAEKRLRIELGQSAARVDSALRQGKWSLTKSQRDALISFDFNTGEGPSVLSEASNVDELKAKIAQYTKQTQGGKKIELPGLVNRRKNELALF